MGERGVRIGGGWRGVRVGEKMREGGRRGRRWIRERGWLQREAGKGFCNREWGHVLQRRTGNHLQKSVRNVLHQLVVNLLQQKMGNVLIFKTRSRNVLLHGMLCNRVAYAIYNGAENK